MLNREFMFLEIDKGRSFEKIYDFVDFLCTERDLEKLSRKLNVVGSVSKFESIDEFKNSLENAGFNVDKLYGNLILFSKPKQEQSIEEQNEEQEPSQFYVFYDDLNNVPLFFTLETKTKEIPKTIEKYIGNTRNISRLWIGPQIMKDIKDDLLDKHPDTKIVYFTGKWLPYYKNKALVRPEVERNIEYKGRDGRETLEEMEYSYGILPRVIEYELPTGVVFRLDRRGIITLKRGKFDEVFQILDGIISKILKVRQAVSYSGYRITELRTKGGLVFERPIQKPWSIKLKEPIDYLTVKEALRKLEEDDVEWNFTVFNDLVIEGSVYFSARIIDNNRHSKFEIISAGTEINLYPIDNVDIGSAITFFAFVLDNIDPQARPILGI